MSEFVPNIRHLRAIFEVARHNSISRASEVMYLSQPAITQAVAKIEKALGVPLFERRSGGVFPTEPGELLLRRIGRAINFIEIGAASALKEANITGQKAGFDNFANLVTTVQLRAIIAVEKAGNFSLAARLEGVTQPSLHRAARDLERLSGLQFYKKDKAGIELTPAAKHFAQNAQLALVELKQGYDEIQEWLGRDSARLVVGALPLARATILPHAINAISKEKPAVNVRVVDGPYGDLLTWLRRGELDLLVGAIRPELPVDDVKQDQLFVDTMVVVARPDHPLCSKKKLAFEDVAGCRWAVARTGTPARNCFANMYEREGLQEPTGIIETSSLTLIRNLLLNGDRLTLISRYQIEPEIKLGILSVLDIDIEDTYREIGVTTRRDWLPTLTQKSFLKHIEEAVQE